jgi:predicted nucleic acid-binding Zn ribbon protein
LFLSGDKIMPIINCIHCGNQVASDAKNCPHCGSETFSKEKARKDLIVLLIAGAGGLYIAYVTWQALSMF